MCLYLVDSDELIEIGNYIENHPKIDSDLEQLCGDGFESIVTDGIIDKGIDDMVKALSW